MGRGGRKQGCQEWGTMEGMVGRAGGRSEVGCSVLVKARGIRWDSAGVASVAAGCRSSPDKLEVRQIQCCALLQSPPDTGRSVAINPVYFRTGGSWRATSVVGYFDGNQVERDPDIGDIEVRSWQFWCSATPLRSVANGNGCEPTVSIQLFPHAPGALFPPQKTGP